MRHVRTRRLPGHFGACCAVAGSFTSPLNLPACADSVPVYTLSDLSRSQLGCGADDPTPSRDMQCRPDADDEHSPCAAAAAWWGEADGDTSAAEAR